MASQDEPSQSVASDAPPALSNTAMDQAMASTPAVMQSATSPISTHHIHYAPDVDAHGSPSHEPPHPTGVHAMSRSDTDLTRPESIPPLHRNPTRVNTFKTVENFDDYELRPGWQPGSEPGFDPSKADGGHASVPELWAPCEITVVDFSQNKMDTNHLDNDTLLPFLKTSPNPPSWAKCRWINVNGLSWDVIQVLGRHKKLHRLALEDVMNTRSRTKVDWYASNAFMVLTLQKLVHLAQPNDEDSDGEDDLSSMHTGRSRRSHKVPARLRAMFGRTRADSAAEKRMETGNIYQQQQAGEHDGNKSKELARANPLLMRTLQRYHASPNEARTIFMERNSALSSRNLAVAAEQVSLFLTNDNCIISFFELSAHDVEQPLMRRLGTLDTVLRQSCDASMLVQGIIDTIIDLAIPVTACYADIIGDLELDVLTRPNIKHTKSLYVIITEVNKILTFVHPIANLINALRDHRSQLSQDAALNQLQDPNTGIIITPQTATYLLDVLDHCVLITEGLTNLKASADGMIGLIFNTISNYQNESMRQLAIVTLIFLPLGFLDKHTCPSPAQPYSGLKTPADVHISGYFGQNFVPFDQLDYGITYFWEIAIPCVFGVFVFLMREPILEYGRSLIQRRHIFRLRKIRRRTRSQKP